MYRPTVLTPAKAGLRRAAAPVSPVSRLGLPYFARVAGLRRREGIASPVPNREDRGHRQSNHLSLRSRPPAARSCLRTPLLLWTRRLRVSFSTMVISGHRHLFFARIRMTWPAKATTRRPFSLIFPCGPRTLGSRRRVRRKKGERAGSRLLNYALAGEARPSAWKLRGSITPGWWRLIRLPARRSA